MEQRRRALLHRGSLFRLRRKYRNDPKRRRVDDDDFIAIDEDAVPAEPWVHTRHLSPESGPFARSLAQRRQRGYSYPRSKPAGCPGETTAFRGDACVAANSSRFRHFACCHRRETVQCSVAIETGLVFGCRFPILVQPRPDHAGLPMPDCVPSIVSPGLSNQVRRTSGCDARSFPRLARKDLSPQSPSRARSCPGLW